MSARPTAPDQLGFDALLVQADAANHRREVARETAHLPSTLAEALAVYRRFIEAHHAAMLAADIAAALRLREEACCLAVAVNGGDAGILGGPDFPGRILERETAAPAGTVPLWGQQGDFCVTAGGIRARIAMDGLFGIGSSSFPFPGFGAYAIDQERPFLSDTGYRSFLGIAAEPVPGLTPERFAQDVIATYIARELRGRLPYIRPEHRRPE